jgi:hypothetical protein
VNNEYDNEELNAKPPKQVQTDRIVRNVLAEKPRVTRFAIKWYVIYPFPLLVAWFLISLIGIRKNLHLRNSPPINLRLTRLRMMVRLTELKRRRPRLPRKKRLEPPLVTKTSRWVEQKTLLAPLQLLRMKPLTMVLRTWKPRAATKKMRMRRARARAMMTMP